MVRKDWRAAEDGPDCRLGLGTLPAHDFVCWAFSVHITVSHSLFSLNAIHLFNIPEAFAQCLLEVLHDRVC